MKRNPAIALLAILAACNSAPSSPAPEASKPAADSPATMKTIQSPYEILYSSQFVIDDPKNAETLLKLWKDYDNGDLSASKVNFADTFDLVVADGTALHLSRDSAIAIVQSIRSGMKSVVDRVHAVMAVKSVDKNEHWALIWGIETDTHKDGKIDSTELQETWRFDSTGKANLIYQYARPAAPPKMTHKKA